MIDFLIRFAIAYVVAGTIVPLWMITLFGGQATWSCNDPRRMVRLWSFVRSVAVLILSWPLLLYRAITGPNG